MQPHSPYFSTSQTYDELEEYEKRPFEAIVTGDEDDQQQVWEAYLDNLRYVLDHVEKLLENVDGTVVITADHGELLGDHGMHYHMPGNPHPKLKKVPWVEVEATDKRTIEPDVDQRGHAGAQDVSEEQLEALGYI
jgi:arylsulfatase A-like enzyme